MLGRIPKINQTNGLRHYTVQATTTLNNSMLLQSQQQFASPKINCFSLRRFNTQKPGAPGGMNKLHDAQGEEEPNFIDILEREIQGEQAELSSRLTSDQFPGYSVETDGSDVKLSKQLNGANVVVRFTVSSSLAEWPSEAAENEKPTSSQEQPEMSTSLVSLPEFEVQITKGDHTLEVSCYFDEMDADEETGQPLLSEPVFNVDELVLYQGTPKETEFAVNAEYFSEEMQEALLHFLARHGIDHEFTRDLVNFATNYEKKQYVSLLKRLKSFAAK